MDYPETIKALLLEIHTPYWEDSGVRSEKLVRISTYGHMVIVATTPGYDAYKNAPDVTVYRMNTLNSAYQVIKVEFEKSDYDNFREWYLDNDEMVDRMLNPMELGELDS